MNSSNEKPVEAKCKTNNFCFQLDEYQLFIDGDEQDIIVKVLKSRDTVADLKAKIEKQTDIPPEQQRLVSFMGKNGLLRKINNLKFCVRYPNRGLNPID